MDFQEHTVSTLDTPFAVEWPYPEDAEFYWAPDRLHFPDPVTPLFAAFYRRMMEGGLNRAAEAYELPVRVRIRRVMGRIYMALTAVPASPNCEKKLAAVMGHLGEIWDGKLLPEVRRALARWEAFDLADSSMGELLVHLTESAGVITRLYEIHFLVWFPFSTALILFEDLCRKLFGEEAATLVPRLLEGFDTQIVEGDQALWELSHKAARSAKLNKLLRETPAGQVKEKLSHTVDGRAFWAKLDEYLKQYGYRTGRAISLSVPYWIEDPTEVIAKLQEYMGQPDRDILEEGADQAAEREKTIQDTLRRLHGRPEEVRERFESLLNAAQEATVLQDDHAFWIDYRAMYEVRRVLLEFGRRFTAEQMLDTPDDIFYVPKTDLRHAAENWPEGDLRPLVNQIKEEMERYRAMPPAAFLGKKRPEPLPDIPAVRALQSFFGE